MTPRERQDVLDIDWLLINDLIEFLEPFKLATLELQSTSKYPSSYVQFMLSDLKAHLERTIRKKAKCEKLAKEIKNKLDFYSNFNEKHFLLCNFFHPAIKLTNLKKKSERETVIKQVENILQSYSGNNPNL